MVAEDEDRKNVVDSVGALAFETGTAIGAWALIEPSDAGGNGCAAWRKGSPIVLFAARGRAPMKDFFIGGCSKNVP